MNVELLTRFYQLFDLLSSAVDNSVIITNILVYFTICIVHSMGTKYARDAIWMVMVWGKGLDSLYSIMNYRKIFLGLHHH